jgi:predicted PurR-regulated permease PerM
MVFAFPFVKDVLIMVIIAWLLSVLLSPLVNFLEHKGFRRGMAILIVMILILAIVGVSFGLLIPRIIRGVESIISKE